MVLTITNVSRSFGSMIAVEEISLRVDIGEIVGLIGPNGAGKTTTMRMAAGVMHPSGGSIRYHHAGLNLDPFSADGHIFRAQIGFLPEGAPLWNTMTVSEFLTDCCSLRQLPIGDNIQRVIELLSLTEVPHRLIGKLSKGFRRRVALAATLVHDPTVLLLDEPADGLDPNQKNKLRLTIKDMAQHKAIVISTHALDEVESLCTRVVVVAHGRVVADDSPQSLRANDPENSMENVFRTLTDNVSDTSVTSPSL